MTRRPYRTRRRDRRACPERSRRACPERSRRACPERSRRAWPERSRREAATLAEQFGRFRHLKRGPADQRFFGTQFPGARLCCGPATVPAQVLVAQNALPRQRCLVIPSHRGSRAGGNFCANGAQKYQIRPFIREAPQGAIGESLARDDSSSLRRPDRSAKRVAEEPSHHDLRLVVETRSLHFASLQRGYDPRESGRRDDSSKNHPALAEIAKTSVTGLESIPFECRGALHQERRRPDAVLSGS